MTLSKYSIVEVINHKNIAQKVFVSIDETNKATILVPGNFTLEQDQGWDRH